MSQCTGQQEANTSLPTKLDMKQRLFRSLFTPFLAKRYYVTFDLLHEPSVCRL